MILKEMEKEKVGVIMIGMKMKMEGKEGKRVKEKRELVRKMKKMKEMKLVLWDERI